MRVSAINIYPIKSLGRISLDKAVTEKRGFTCDRRWMLVDEDNMFLTQRAFPQMATVSVKLAADKLVVSAAGAEDLAVPLIQPSGGETVRVTVWDSVCDAVVLPEKMNRWFSDVLAKKCRLVFMPDASERQIHPRFNRRHDLVSFADGYPFLLIGENSLSDLNERLDQPVPMRNFRPNLVVSGSPAYAEDRWQKLQIGKAVFRAAKPCARCVVTTLDQTTGEKLGKEPLQTLSTYRRARDVFPERLADLGLDESSVVFGQNLIAETFGETVAVGDEVRLLA